MKFLKKINILRSLPLPLNIVLLHPKLPLNTLAHLKLHSVRRTRVYFDRNWGPRGCSFRSVADDDDEDDELKSQKDVARQFYFRSAAGDKRDANVFDM